MSKGGLCRSSALVMIAAMIMTLETPGVSSVASPPACGNANATSDHCYVGAAFDDAGGHITSMTGLFTTPKKLAVKSPAYSIAQIALESPSADIELGWIVSPSNYHNQSPHLFVFFRGGINEHYCEDGIPGDAYAPPCPLSDSAGYVNLPSKYFPGMNIGGTSSFFYVGYDSQDNFWYIQYQNQYIGKMSGLWWGRSLSGFNFTGGELAAWYGEVAYPNASYACTPMGNGIYGSHKNSATISDMLYGTGNGFSAAPVQLSRMDYPGYWDSNMKLNQRFSSSFSFGGPYGGSNACKVPAGYSG
jgi:hypothetical protein